MGLDMYLYADKYVSNSSDVLIEKFPEYRMDKEQYEQVMGITGMNALPTPEFGGAHITKCVAYWRKANAIHGWIVRNLANGVDTCQRIDVTREDLITLRDSCVKALANRANATPNKETTISFKDDGSNAEAVVNSIIEKFKLEAKNFESNTMLADPLELEPTAGFFFGSTDKDEYYYRDIEYTIEVLNSLIAISLDSEYSFYYQASW